MCARVRVWRGSACQSACMDFRVCVTFCACVPRARATARERACVLTRLSPCQAARGAAEEGKPTTAGTDGAGAGESISNSATVPPASRHAPHCASAHERARAKVTTRACAQMRLHARVCACTNVRLFKATQMCVRPRTQSCTDISAPTLSHLHFCTTHGTR